MSLSLPIPDWFEGDRVGEVWRVPYAQLATKAQQWAKANQITPAQEDSQRIALLMIDVQNTFCIPDFELFVGGRSGQGAVEDNVRLCQFIYRNLSLLTELIPTLDTHGVAQIFHPIFWVDAEGNHPEPLTNIDWEAVKAGRWRPNPQLQANFLPSADSISQSAFPDRSAQTEGMRCDLAAYAAHYTQTLEALGKYPLTIWPYHSLLGGIGHALVSAVEAACFTHAIVRQVPTRFELKGSHPLTENYSILSPEILSDEHQQPIAQKNQALIQHLFNFDAVIIAGQAKSHCVAWTVADFLKEIQTQKPEFVDRVYLLEDCMSPVVVPGVVDFTELAEQTFQNFALAGMHLVRSTDSIEQWPLFNH
jgi:nicotinamidase-related amidase